MPVATGGATYGQPNPARRSSPPSRPRPSCRPATPPRPISAPQEVKDAIAAANEIIGKPYVYGGGHNAKFLSRGYDCSGTVSYALHGADLLHAPAGLLAPS